VADIQSIKTDLYSAVTCKALCGPQELQNRASSVSRPEVVRGDQTWLLFFLY